MPGFRRRRPTPAVVQRQAHPVTPTARARCIETLVAALTAGRLTDDDFELRWTTALEATSVRELQALLDDLEDPPEPDAAE